MYTYPNAYAKVKKLISVVQFTGNWFEFGTIKMIFEALQSELFRFKFHSPSSKIPKILEFSLLILAYNINIKWSNDKLTMESGYTKGSNAETVFVVWCDTAYLMLQRRLDSATTIVLPPSQRLYFRLSTAQIFYFRVNSEKFQNFDF